jgi:tensin
MASAKAAAASASASLSQIGSVDERTSAAHFLNIHYVTDRIIIMGTPSPRTVFAQSQPQTHAAATREFLDARHAGKYMLYNLSEQTYDYAAFHDHVIEFRFPGYPAPPLATLFSMCKSMHGWLRADAENIIVVHCQTVRLASGGN